MKRIIAGLLCATMLFSMDGYRSVSYAAGHDSYYSLEASSEASVGEDEATYLSTTNPEESNEEVGAEASNEAATEATTESAATEDSSEAATEASTEAADEASTVSSIEEADAANSASSEDAADAASFSAMLTAQLKPMPLRSCSLHSDMTGSL